MLQEAVCCRRRAKREERVVARRATMPRTALRYAIEKMPPELKAEAMQKIT